MSGEAPAAPSGSKEVPYRRALVIEDEGVVAMLVEDMLLELGWDVAAVAGRLDHAMEEAGRGGFDFAVLDLNLDGCMSYPVADVLRARGIPFVFASGYGRRGLDDGYRDVPLVQKPFDAQALRQAVLEALGTAAPA